MTAPNSLSILKPGLLVSLKTNLNGGVSYERTDLAVPDALAPFVGDASDEPSKPDIARWETTRIIEDAEEHKRAVTARNAARRTISAICTQTSFGLLCPQDREAELDNAVREARKIVDAHNATAKHTQVNVYVLKGRIAGTDEEAARAIASDVRDLLSQMEAGIKAVDVTAIREAAKKAKQMGAVLDEAQAKLVSEAVAAARDAARQIVRRVESGGESAEVVLGELDTGAIEKARFSFLDLDGEAPVESLPAIDVQRTAELDLEPAVLPEPKPSAPPVQLDLIDDEIPTPALKCYSSATVRDLEV